MLQKIPAVGLCLLPCAGDCLPRAHHRAVPQPVKSVGAVFGVGTGGIVAVHEEKHPWILAAKTAEAFGGAGRRQRADSGIAQLSHRLRREPVYQVHSHRMHQPGAAEQVLQFRSGFISGARCHEQVLLSLSAPGQEGLDDIAAQVSGNNQSVTGIIALSAEKRFRRYLGGGRAEQFRRIQHSVIAHVPGGVQRLRQLLQAIAAQKGKHAEAQPNCRDDPFQPAEQVPAEFTVPLSVVSIPGRQVGQRQHQLHHGRILQLANLFL